MLLPRRELPVLLVNLIYISLFATIAFRELNLEFLLYTGVVVAVAGWVVWKQSSGGKSLGGRFDLHVLWGLTIWGFLHLSGGNLRTGGEVLYNLELIRLWPRYHILRYDQVVHAFGFGVAALVCHHLLRPYLRERIARWGTLSGLIVLMGAGVGSINEIIEFIAVERVPETNVGGYDNTLLDLIFNVIGGVLAVTFLAWRRRSSDPLVGVDRA